MIRIVPVEELQAAGAVARNYALSDIALLNVQVMRTHPVWTAPLSNASVNSSDSADCEFQDDGESLLVRVSFRCAAGTTDDKGVMTSEFLVIEGTFELLYMRAFPEAKVTPEQAQLFAKINGVYNAWPYIRELVSSNFTRLGFPSFTLGSLVITPPQPEEKKAVKVAKKVKA